MFPIDIRRRPGYYMLGLFNPQKTVIGFDKKIKY